jgi:hypothetical protein
MTEVCDPDADIENLRKTIKLQTGEDVKLTRKQMCDAYNNIQGGKLPLPPLVMSADRTYLVDRASPLKHLEYELLFDSTTKRVDLKKIARKVGLTSQIEQMTKKQLVGAIGKRLRYLKVREPIKIVSKRLITKTVPESTNNTAVNNTAVNNTAVNNTAVNNTVVNNTAVNNNRRNFNNNSAFNNTENRGSNFNNFGNNKNENGGNNNNSVRLSGNVNGLKFNKNKNNNSQTSFKFPNKLSFNGSFGSSNKKNSNSGTQTNVGTGTNSGPPPTQFGNGFKAKPAFLTSTSTSTGTNSGPPPTQFGNGFKAKPAFMNKMANKTTNGPKKPGMFNWMFKKKGAAAAAAGATAAAAGVTAANGPKKCGMMNRMMGRCKTNGPKNNGTTTNNGPKNNGTTTNNGPKNNGTTTNNGPKNNGTTTNNGPKNNGTTTNNGPSRDVAIVANKLLTEINKDVAKEVRNNTSNNKVVVNRVRNGIINHVLKKNVTNSINKFNSGLVGGSNNKKNVNVNTETKNLMNRVNKANTLVDLRKVFLTATLKLHPNKGGDEASFKLFMNAHNMRKSKILNPSNVNSLANQIMKEINKDVIKEIGNKSTIKNKVKTNNKVNMNADIKFVADKIYNKMRVDVNKKIKNGIGIKSTIKNKVKTNNKVNLDADIKFVADKIYNQMRVDVNKKVRNGIRLGGRASESRKPVYNNNSNSNNKINNNKNENKKNLIMVNNPTFNSNNKNNFKNASNNAFKINNGEISAESLTNSTKLNNIPKEIERQENDVRDIIKNLNSEKEKLKNKITKELNLRPNNNGVFKEREGITKGKIGVWAKELRKADTTENLKSIENKLNKKTSLRKNIENKYTKMGLTKVEKMNHRRKVVKFMNNVDERRKLVEIQVKNKNNNNNTNSVVSNYNSDANANSNEPKKKMKYGSRENFINAKKVELRELAKNTSTNFGRNIDRMKNRTNVTKLRGRIEGAVLRDEALKKVNTRPRSERRVDNKAVLKNLKKKVKKNNPGFSPAKVNVEARRLRDLSKK